MTFDQLQKMAAAAVESNDLKTWRAAATEIYRRCGGRVHPDLDDAILWDGDRPWEGWYTYTETELREYVADINSVLY